MAAKPQALLTEKKGPASRRTAYLIGGLSLFGLLGLGLISQWPVFGEGTPESVVPDTDVKNATLNPADLQILASLELRRATLDRQEADIQQREARLALAEKDLLGRLKELRSLRDEISAQVAQRKVQDDARMVAMSTSLSRDMKPGKAAGLLAAMDTDMAVKLMALIPNQKLAAILEKMDEGRASKLTAAYLNQGRKLASSGAAGADAFPPAPPALAPAPLDGAMADKSAADGAPKKSSPPPSALGGSASDRGGSDKGLTSTAPSDRAPSDRAPSDRALSDSAMTDKVGANTDPPKSPAPGSKGGSRPASQTGGQP